MEQCIDTLEHASNNTERIVIVVQGLLTIFHCYVRAISFNDVTFIQEELTTIL